MTLLADLDWGNWIYGMWLAISSGVATAGVSSMSLYFANPKEHNPLKGEFWMDFGIVLAMTGGSSFFAYLKQNPGPKVISRSKTSMTATDAQGGVITMERTVEKSTPAPIPTPSPESDTKKEQ